MNAGKIEKHFEVTCGKCHGDWEHPPAFHGVKFAESWLRKLGWAKTTAYGWVCASCNLKNLNSK